jgi:hypothetical protein
MSPWQPKPKHHQLRDLHRPHAEQSRVIRTNNSNMTGAPLQPIDKVPLVETRFIKGPHRKPARGG